MKTYEQGQRECAEKLMAWLNTFEDLNVPKSNVYELGYEISSNIS